MGRAARRCGGAPPTAADCARMLRYGKMPGWVLLLLALLVLFVVYKWYTWRRGPRLIKVAAPSADVFAVMRTRDQWLALRRAAPLLGTVFYADGCTHCTNAWSMFRHAAATLAAQGVPLVALESRHVTRDDSIKGYPTLRVYHNGVVSTYRGPRDASSVVQFVHGCAAK